MTLIYKRINNDYAYYNLDTNEKICETQKEATKFLLKEEKEQKKVSNPNITYLICINCGELTTSKEQLELIEKMGSQGMCYCDYDNGRIFYPYYKINKGIYEIFKKLTKEERLILLYSITIELKEW